MAKQRASSVHPRANDHEKESKHVMTEGVDGGTVTGPLNERKTTTEKNWRGGNLNRHGREEMPTTPLPKVNVDP